MKEINVIGTMQLLAACQKAPAVRKLVVKSTTAIYGSSVARSGAVHRGLAAARRCRARLRQGRRRGRGLRPRLRPPPARCRGQPCCGSPTSSGPRIDSSLTPLPVAAGGADRARLRPADPAAATRTTRWRCCGSRRWTDRPGIVQRRPAAASCCCRRPSDGRAAVDPGAVAGRQRHRWAAPPGQADRRLPGADPLPRARPGGRHRAAARTTSATRRATRPRRRSTTSAAVIRSRAC